MFRNGAGLGVMAGPGATLLLETWRWQRRRPSWLLLFAFAPFGVDLQHGTQ